MSSERISLEIVDFAPLSAAGIGRRLVEMAKQWRKRVRQRETLLRLSPYMLRDIGISEADVWRETRTGAPRWLE